MLQNDKYADCSMLFDFIYSDSYVNIINVYNRFEYVLHYINSLFILTNTLKERATHRCKVVGLPIKQ